MNALLIAALVGLWASLAAGGLLHLAYRSAKDGMGRMAAWQAFLGVGAYAAGCWLFYFAISL